MKKILIVYGSIGLGHKVVAENIARALGAYSDIEVVKLDTLELYRGQFLKSWGVFYEWMIKRVPALWGFFYTNRVLHKLSLPLRVPLARLKLAKFQDFVLQAKPDLIVTAHPQATALAVALKSKGLFAGPIVTTFSDFHFQPFWVYPGVDHYLVMTGEQLDQVKKYGFSENQITVTGLPVDPIYLKDYPASAIAHEFDLKVRKPLVVVMGGSRGWGVKVEDVQALLSSRFDIQIAVVTGKNQDLVVALSPLADKFHENLRVLAQWDQEPIAKLFSLAKILVTKPGGLTCAQALVRGLPMILVNPLPTMEEMNQDYLVGRGAAVAAGSSEELVAWVERLLADKKLYTNMQEKQKALTKPHAAEIAAKRIIDTLEKRY